MNWEKILRIVTYIWVISTITIVAHKLYTTSQVEVEPSPMVLVKTEYIEVMPEDDFMGYIGEFEVTAYCPCEKCCGEYGKNRETAYGKVVVNTASGAFAQEGITVAADPSVLPYGTKIYIEGLGVRVVQDCGGGVKGDRLDVYFNNHSDALEYGRQQRAVWTINEEVDLSN